MSIGYTGIMFISIFLKNIHLQSYVSKRAFVEVELCLIVGWVGSDQDIDERKYFIKHHPHKFTDCHVTGTKEMNKTDMYQHAHAHKGSMDRRAGA